MADEYTFKKKVEYKIDKTSETERKLEDASDKVQAAAKAVVHKVADPDRNLELEYRKEKLD